MDPITVLTTLWRNKWVALPVVLLTAAACIYVYLFAPRTYEANVSYALTAPAVPSNYELENDPEVAKLNSNNPYLRSSDSSLLAQVVITKLSDPVYVEQLKNAGFGSDFKIAPVASLGMGLVTVSASSESPAEAVETAKLVGEQFTTTLTSVQKINGADDRYLYTPILVRGPGPAKEMYSNRLRSLIMVAIAGSVLLFGAVSVARSVRLRAQRRTQPADGKPADGKPEDQPTDEPLPGRTRRSEGRRAAPSADAFPAPVRTDVTAGQFAATAGRAGSS